MTRAAYVLPATGLGLAAVLSFHPHAPAAAPPKAVASGSAAPAGSGNGGARTYLGDAIDTQYGAAQVRVTIKGGRIADVEAVQLPGNEPKSIQISGASAPQLRASALTRQSGDIDAVSGATVTSAGYEASLQSALDKAGFEPADGSRGSSAVPQLPG